MGELIQSVMNLVNKVRVEKFKLETKRISFVLFVWFLGLTTGVTFYYAIGAYTRLLEPRTIVINNVSASTEEKPAEVKIVNPEAPKEKDLADYIWFKESTRGKNNYSKCESQGKINGIGFGIPGNGKFQCFESHADEMKALNEWISQHKEEGLTDKQLLCHYNLGTISETCDYISSL